MCEKHLWKSDTLSKDAGNLILVWMVMQLKIISHLRRLKIIAIVKAIENYRIMKSKWKSDNFLLLIFGDSLKSME